MLLAFITLTNNDLDVRPYEKRVYIAFTFDRNVIYYDILGLSAIKANSVTGHSRSNVYVAILLIIISNSMSNSDISIVSSKGNAITLLDNRYAL